MSQGALAVAPPAVAPPEAARPVVRVSCECGHRGRYRMAAVMTLGRLATFVGPGPYGIGCPECGRRWGGCAAGREDRRDTTGSITNGTTSEPWLEEERAKVNGPEWDAMPVQPSPWADPWRCSCVTPIPVGSTDPCPACLADPAEERRARQAAKILDGRDGPENGRPALDGWAGPRFDAAPETDDQGDAPETSADRRAAAQRCAEALTAARTDPPAPADGTCERCDADHWTPCPHAFECPACQAAPWAACKRPSGHRAAVTHTTRIALARAHWTPAQHRQEADFERQQPAPEPAAAPRPLAVPEPLALF